MKFSTISRATTALIAVFIFSAMFAGHALASVTWLSSITKTDVPTRIAVDAKGNIYVSEPRNRNRILVLNRQGNVLRSLYGLSAPVGVAVDGNSRIYVGNSGTGSVDVYNADLGFALSLGSGRGEFILPSSIAITAEGTAYVVDTEAHSVKVYNPNGSKAFSFGQEGQGDGKFNQPMGIAIDEAKNEVYVTDRGFFMDPTYGKTPGARVHVFDLSGTFLRSFGQFGSGPGQMKKAEDIATDGAGYLYVTDPNRAAIHVFAIDGSWQETISDSAHVLKTPIGIAIGRDKRMFLASSNGPSIEVYGLAGYTSLSIDPKTINFSAVAGGSNPAAQSVSIKNSGNGVLDWTAKTATSDGASWLAATAGGAADASGSTMTISVLSGALAAGSYTGTVTVTAAGAEETIAVNLAVSAPPAILAVDRTTVNFKAQQGGSSPLPQLINITNSGTGPMAWSATPSAAWLNIAAGSSSVTISPDSTGFAAGTYQASITVAAPGAQDSPVSVAVTMQVVQAGTLKITSNITNASFDIAGPQAFSGSGRSWKNDSVVPGDYTVAFKHIVGYSKPAAKKVSIATGQEIVVAGDYKKKQIPTHVIAGSVQGDALVSIIPLAPGSASRSFAPFAGNDSVRVASGDIDGSGLNSVVVTDSKKSVKVFSVQGPQETELASYELAEGSKHADAVVGDMDNDGRAEIVISAVNEGTRIIKALSYAGNKLTEKQSLLLEEKSGKFSVGLGDVNEDGFLDVLVADAASVRAFSLDAKGTALTQLWTKSVNYSDDVQIAAGDLNGDGIAEIVVSYEQASVSKRRGKERSSLIGVFKGTGEDYGLTIEPFKDLGYGKAATLSLGDVDGDGADELIAGAGPSEGNEAVIRTFESDGTYAGTTMKPMNSKAGVNVGLGSF